MKKIEVEFEVSFANDKPLPIVVGRLIVGGHYSVRITFDIDGKLKLVIPQEAIDHAAVIVTPRLRQEDLTYLGLTKP